MAPEEERAFESALVEDYDSIVSKTCFVDVAKAQATKEKDRRLIFEALNATLGFQEVN